MELSWDFSPPVELMLNIQGAPAGRNIPGFQPEEIELLFINRLRMEAIKFA
jgi:hypothetical protein